MSTIEKVFDKLRKTGRKAFMPFVTAGDPDLGFTTELIQALSDAGSSLIEVGVPYSDPIADGPVIQASYTRALQRGVRSGDVLKSLAGITPRLSTPVVLMVSYAIVFRRGLGEFVDQAGQAGVAGLIVPDLPIEECEPLREACDQRGLDLVQLITPTTPRPRAIRIAQAGRGFLYYVSVAGITGERRELPKGLVENLVWLRGQTSLPICVGFGISRPEHVRLLAPVVDGIIVGSAIVRHVAAIGEKPRSRILEEVRDHVAELIAALPPSCD
ncbi:MAG: tryptophan synthase subunit alpha [Thermogutta sp.]|nr:tryptophan synthase subunit alpha [Thermogutta sp.]